MDLSQDQVQCVYVHGKDGTCATLWHMSQSYPLNSTTTGHRCRRCVCVLLAVLSLWHNEGEHCVYLHNHMQSDSNTFTL